MNYVAWCSKSARLLVRDRLGSNCVRKFSARILLGSKVARNFSARNVILIENDRIEMLEHLKFLLVHIPKSYVIIDSVRIVVSNYFFKVSRKNHRILIIFGKCQPDPKCKWNTIITLIDSSIVAVQVLSIKVMRALLASENYSRIVGK